MKDAGLGTEGDEAATLIGEGLLSRATRWALETGSAVDG